VDRRAIFEISHHSANLSLLSPLKNGHWGFLCE
jgi:hypothetical protein